MWMLKKQIESITEATESCGFPASFFPHWPPHQHTAQMSLADQVMLFVAAVALQPVQQTFAASSLTPWPVHLKQQQNHPAFADKQTTKNQKPKTKKEKLLCEESCLPSPQVTSVTSASSPAASLWTGVWSWRLFWPLCSS